MSAGQLPGNIVVFGVGHSGTSILTRMLFALGWERNDADEVFCESVGLRALNDAYRQGGDAGALHGEGLDFVRGLSRPFALKDPRLVFTMPLWVGVFGELAIAPLLLRITRDAAALGESYRERGELFDGGPGMYGRSLDRLIAECDAQYAAWPFAKATIAYERLVDAASLVRRERRMRRDGGLWLNTDGEVPPDQAPDDTS